ncbi:aromatic-ring-hydroxylating dioxygenase subunit beta [Pseudomonas aeruginosa]|nr:aromatic-ring-hydroxylating dioxygenase subunit beta [Pseudomonas aeruginosa]
MSLALSRPDSDLLARVSDFLVAEAELLDDRLLDTWFALFERAARYRVLPLQEQLAGQAPEDSLYIIDDDLRASARGGSTASSAGIPGWSSRARAPAAWWATCGWKRVEGELVSSRSNFVVHQFRNREAWNFVGEASHVLRDGPEGLRIVSREIRLDHETISAQRRISIIL